MYFIYIENESAIVITRTKPNRPGVIPARNAAEAERKAEELAGTTWLPIVRK